MRADHAGFGRDVQRVDDIWMRAAQTESRTVESVEGVGVSAL